jgi:outer membrane protein OmpA-like peptidoglycan-associated protein
MHMIRHRNSACQAAAIITLSLLAACTQTPPPRTAMSNPPPTAPGSGTVWYTATFVPNSAVLDSQAQQVVDQAAAFLHAHPGSLATLIGRTDTVGSNDYNMRLSHHRADAVRDELVYTDHIPAKLVETRWTGEARAGVPTTDDKAVAENRVVDIAVH